MIDIEKEPMHDQFDSDVVYKIKEMYHVQKIQIQYSKKLSEICQLSKRLRNKAVFIGRQVYFLLNKKDYSLNTMYPSLAKELLDFMEIELDSPKLTDELHFKLFIDHTYEDSKELRIKLLNILKKFDVLNKFIKFRQEYKNLGQFYSTLPQQVLKYVSGSWKSYFYAKKRWKKNPENFLGVPKIPSIRRRDKEFLISFPGMYFNNSKYAKSIVKHYYNTKRISKTYDKRTRNVKNHYTTGELLFPQKFQQNFSSNSPFPKIRVKISIERIKEIRIVPKKCCYEVQIVYKKQIKRNKDLSNDNVGAIDIGLNIIVAMVTNLGTAPILISGKRAKSINQYMNKKIAHLRKIQIIDRKLLKKGEHIPESIEMSRIRRKRNKIIEDHFHKVSRYIINYCLEHKIGRLAIGYNTRWKQEIKLGKKNNQNFVYIPFRKLIEMIKYKAKLVGISIKLINESYTSKCSALDFESIEYHDQYLGCRKPSTLGRKKGRVEYNTYYPRGLFRSAKGLIIHSDVNGAFNIGRKTFPEVFNKKKLLLKNMIKNPITIRI